MQYIKYNKVLVKPGKRDDSTEAILEFFKVDEVWFFAADNGVFYPIRR